VKSLVALGVEKKDIELLEIDEGFFGTLGEAREVSAIIAERGYGQLIIVTSSSHTSRVILSFSNELLGSGIRLYVHASNDPVGLKALLREYIKLIAYKNLLVG
jgi:uncharacterized SAM-binding protein YcdF (DUF218 family)